ncbi:S-adenosylmethionine decarboxylase [Paenibacillus piri]|uniref:S-adenosylmethionine decarboxylase n=1 Tax=Paenibacillus piri TaxID=2547395 RepID=A0A4R5KPV7_9BACL|nr:S-adenosylmethionine decarboxylase [Paenibacillus piri]TDF97616.1 S-adenosylmethionine decarboxylase [Paenibacillus piri]
MKRKKKLYIYVLLLFLVVWPVYQIVGMLGGHAEKQNAGKLLYQVSMFQMELLGSFLNDVNQMQGTGGLDLLRQAVYTANFTHEHLVLAFGEDRLTPLNGLTQLMQYVVRLQIGGQRPLKADEAQTLEQIRKQYADMFDAYGKLMSPSYSIVSAQNDKLMKADKAMTELLRKKLLQ